MRISKAMKGKARKKGKAKEEKECIVLRLNHRIVRDKRISTHLAMFARAVGCKELIYSGERDREMEKRIENISSRWGGSFRVLHSTSPKKFIKEMKEKGYKIVHLTMYGLPFEKRIEKLKKEKIVVIVGSEKVPGYIYSLSDENLAVGNQPHSELSALAIFLYQYFGKMKESFENAKLFIVPSKSKKILKER